MTLNNKTKTYLVVGLSLVAMLASSSSLSAVFAQVTTPSNVFSVQEDAIPSEILQKVSQMSQHTKEATYLNIEKRVPGFSGAYVDEHGVLNVYTTDSSIKSIDKSMLADYVDQDHLAKGIIVKQSNHSWHKWMELENIVTKLAENKDLGITSTGVDDKNQVFRISFEHLNSTKIDVVNKFLADHNIPSNMVKLVETGKVVLLGSGISFTPIMAGLEIWVKDAPWSPPPPVCTTGFIVKDSNGNYRGLTAGHCQAYPAHWNDGTQQYYQPYNGRYIGNEISGSMKTTNSDSLLFGLGTETGGFGKIFRYGGQSQLTITTKASSEFVGDTICTSGTGSGTTRCGSITVTGVTTYANGSPIGHTHTNLASFTAIGGDSGSPVWHAYQFNGISAYGMVFAADSAGTYYSDINGIQADQGTLQFN